MKISWNELKFNEEVLRVIVEKRCLIKQIEKESCNFWTHHEERGNGKSNSNWYDRGQKGRGRSREKYIDGLLNITRKTNVNELLHITRD